MSTVVLKNDMGEACADPIMRFRLVYNGPLLSTRSQPTGDQRDPRAGHKHAIRRNFHIQLKRFWEKTNFLGSNNFYGFMWGLEKTPEMPLKDFLADQYSRFNYRFVPLVIEEFKLECSLRILLLRRESPGHIIGSGDIDNRIKTLFDALRMPQNKAELEGNNDPIDGENPFFVLLRDDSLISHAEIETDTLWQPPLNANEQDYIRIIVHVLLHPYDVNMFNLAFA